MTTRRQGREWALQALVQFDLNPPPQAEDALVEFWDQQITLEREALEADERGARVVFDVSDDAEVVALARTRKFAEERVLGVWREREKLDAALEPFLQNWSLYRLGTVERSALRLGAWEILNCPDIPVPIVVNEAVDLVKFFSETRSGRFVNGVLDHFAKELKKRAGEGTFTPESAEPAKD